MVSFPRRASLLAPLAIAAATALLASPAIAQADPTHRPYMPRSDQERTAVPAEVLPFIPEGHEAVTADSADLNLDGRIDYLLFAEISDSAAAAREQDGRALLVLARAADGSLSVAARSDRAVLCRSCGGMMGDPVQGMRVRHGGFTLYNYGGSGWRWATNFTFVYSLEQRTWLLKKADEVSYHASYPDKMKQRIYLRSRDFGRITFSEFDPENYRPQAASDR